MSPQRPGFFLYSNCLAPHSFHQQTHTEARTSWGSPALDELSSPSVGATKGNSDSVQNAGAGAGAVEVTQQLATVAVRGDGPVWKTHLDTEKGLELASPGIWGLGKSWVGGAGDQPPTGAHSDTSTDTHSGTWLHWRCRPKHPPNHLLRSTDPPPFRTEEQRLRV